MILRVLIDPETGGYSVAVHCELCGEKIPMTPCRSDLPQDVMVSREMRFGDCPACEAAFPIPIADARAAGASGHPL